MRIEGWDARTAAGWGPLVNGADAIVNLAGASIAGEGFLPARWTEARKRLIRDSRVNAGAAFCEAITQADKRPSVLLQASAVGYYGTHRAEVDVTEESPPGSDWLAQVCRDWEESTLAVEALGVRRVLLRTGIVLSFESGALPTYGAALSHVRRRPAGQWPPALPMDPSGRPGRCDAFSAARQRCRRRLQPVCT